MAKVNGEKGFTQINKVNITDKLMLDGVAVSEHINDAVALATPPPPPPPPPLPDISNFTNPKANFTVSFGATVVPSNWEVLHDNNVNNDGADKTKEMPDGLYNVTVHYSGGGYVWLDGGTTEVIGGYSLPVNPVTQYVGMRVDKGNSDFIKVKCSGNARDFSIRFEWRGEI